MRKRDFHSLICKCTSDKLKLLLTKTANTIIILLNVFD